jgi:hypothetical protein
MLGHLSLFHPYDKIYSGERSMEMNGGERDKKY